jgi:CubicO group peptidase (beta-lactamase class C family)
VNLTVVDGGEVVRVEGDPDEQFQAGSISKPVAAYLTLRLAEAGVLGLDDPVDERLVSWRLPAAAGVTIRHLLTHTAGLGTSFFPGYGPNEPAPTLVQVLDGAPPAVTEPVRVGTPLGEFRYSGGGYALLQLLLEDVSGRPFAVLARELVFEPLGMSRSTFEQRGGTRRYPEQAAAGLWMTTADLTRFVAALQRDAGMQAARLELPADGEWNVVGQLGMAVPSRFALAGLLVDGWFGFLGGAHDRFSAYFGDTDGSRAVVASGPQGAAPELLTTVVAAAGARGWQGLAA